MVTGVNCGAFAEELLIGSRPSGLMCVLPALIRCSNLMPNVFFSTLARRLAARPGLWIVNGTELSEEHRSPRS